MRNVFVVLVFISQLAYGQKSKNQVKTVEDLVIKLSEVKLSTQPIRLAIVPFTSSVPSSDPKNTFGEYLTESIIGKLSENTTQFKLFERSRLDAIFKENELMLSGMMKPSEALKIGELLPIDALFSGTYTKLKSYIDVSGRLIDVTSGEILTSYSGRIKMSKNIQTLFPEGNTTTPAAANTSTPSTTTTNITVVTANPEYKPSEEERCRQKVNDFKLMLNDLSTQEKTNAIALEAMKTPFDNLCGKLHYEVMYSFKRYKVQNEDYHTFLLSTMEQIALPSQDDRTSEIIRFLCKDHDLNATEWKTTLNSIAKVEYGFYRYLDPVFDATDVETGKKRIDDYFQLVNAEKLGLPKPATYDQAFYQMMQGLGKHQELLLYTYEHYAEKLTTEPTHTVSNHMLYLKRMYEAEANPETKSKIIRWVAVYFQKYRNDKSPEQLYDWAYQYALRENPNGNKSIDEQNQEKAQKYPAQDLALLIQLCKDKFTEYATDTPYPSQQENRIDFCVANNIPVPGVIPSMAEAEQLLKSNDLKEQQRVLKLLMQMGNKPKPLESSLIALFDKRSLEDKDLLIENQSYAMAILGNIHTSNSKAIDYMISKVMSYNYKESDNAQEALTKIGKAAVPGLINSLKATTIHDGGLRYKLIVLLGKNGKDAKAAEPVLLKIQKENGNKDIAYAIEAALQEIR